MEEADPGCANTTSCRWKYCSCLLHGKRVDWPWEQAASPRDRWPLLGRSFQLTMQLSEEAAINAFLNLTSAVRVRPYHTTPYTYSTPENLSWVAYNPSFAPGGVLYNVKSTRWMHGLAHTSVMWIKRQPGRAWVRRVIPNAEDARPFVLNRTVHAIFARYRQHQRKDVWLARLEDPYSEVKLLYAARHPSEGNWLPFVHKGRLFVSYSLCPHRVLAVDPQSGVCTRAFETTRAEGCEARERSSASGYYAGGTDTVVGLGHMRLRFFYYVHFLFERRAKPPFEILRRSKLFRFPTVLAQRGAYQRGNWLGTADTTRQFALSLRACARRASAGLIVDMSATDQLALTAHLPRHALCNLTGWARWCTGADDGKGEECEIKRRFLIEECTSTLLRLETL